MDVNSHNQNQSYWFVFREDQSNVIFSSNNLAVQNPTQITAQEGARYIVDAGDNRQFIHIDGASIPVLEEHESGEREDTKHKDDEIFWDPAKIKILLTLCLENKLSNTLESNEEMWEDISATLGTTKEECNRKYRHVRRTYIRLLRKKKMGRHIKWSHFNLCDEIFREYNCPSVSEPWEDSQVRRLLNLYIDNLDRFRNSDCLHKEIWQEMAAQLGSTEYNCYHKFKNLKKIYLNWLERHRKTGKSTRKWQYQHYFDRIYYNHSPTGPWSRLKTKQLLDAYAQLSDKFRNPKFQKKELWKEVSVIVGESPNDCDRKFRNLKQTYVKLKNKADCGRRNTKWRHFKDFEAIFNSPHDDEVNGVVYLEREDYISQLLQFYVNHKEQFRDPLVKKKNVWKIISPKLRMSPEECDRKFRNLKQTYIRLAQRKKDTGQCVKWPYYSYFEKIYDNIDNSKTQSESYQSNRGNVDGKTLLEIKKVVQEVTERRDGNEKFEKLLRLVEESNCIQRERNRILKALINQK